MEKTTSEATLYYAQFLLCFFFLSKHVCVCVFSNGRKYFPDTLPWLSQAHIYAKFIKSSCRQG